MRKIIRLVGIALLLLSSLPLLAADTWQIEWIEGESGPPSWEITPPNPTTNDIIHFSGPTHVYSNSCVATRTIGLPQLSIDAANRQIELWFKYVPPGPCPMVYDPVCGLQGQFGPLDAGDWLFFSRDLLFSTSFDVTRMYLVTVQILGSGSVSQSPDPPYHLNDEVTVVAEPVGGWRFVRWMGDVPTGRDTDNPLTLTMHADKTITAIFGRLITVPQDYPSIQAAIDAASDYDTITVSPGTYPENIHFGGKNIILQSRDPTDLAVVAATVIDGNQSGSVVTFAGTENETCVLSGFTIRNGKADYGAGICGGTWDQHTRATIRNNVVTANEAGGVEARHGDGGGLAYCDGLIENNAIAGNVARIAPLWSWETGAGGLHACNGEIRNNTISDNSSEGFGLGGGLCLCQGIIHGNTIVRNHGNYGGGLAHCDGTIKNNRICLNTARRGAGLYECEGTVRNNAIIGNVAVQEGGGICFFELPPPSGFTAEGPTSACGGDFPAQQPVVESCTIVRNSAGGSGGGVAFFGGSISNCIIWGNTAANGTQVHESSVPAYSCIEDWTGGGEGNTTQDPRFVDPDGPDDDPATFNDNNYRLSTGSPCIDAGKNRSWMGKAVDLDGNPRIIGATVDMGAYEYVPFNLTAVRLSADGDFTLAWKSRQADVYTVWSCLDLSTNLWVKEATIFLVAPKSPVGIPLSWTDPAPYGRIKFYRIETK